VLSVLSGDAEVRASADGLSRASIFDRSSSSVGSGGSEESFRANFDGEEGPDMLG
jgi:hypothetical protein